MEDTTKEKIDFINKASNCDYNHIWKCKHPKQRGIKCEKICKYYHNSYEQEEVETINN